MATISLNSNIEPLSESQEAKGLIPIPDGKPELSPGHLTVYGLAKLAFRGIPQDFADERGEIARRLDAMDLFEGEVVVNIFGPDEGVYYIHVPDLGQQQPK